MKSRFKPLLVSLLLIFSITGLCGSADYDPIDYAQAKYWLHMPASVDKAVDVFYLYPTAWVKTNPSDPGICNIDNASMLHLSKMAFKRQATAFEPIGNIYAPYYRQVDLSLPAEERSRLVNTVPTHDGIAAFDYYLKHFNNGRPYILASHSQGSNVMVNLLSSYMKEHPEAYKRMIAAYVIGYTVTDAYLAANPHLKFAQGPDDTGVIISYNTEAPDTKPGTNPVVLPGALAINPITWSRCETLAPATQNLGSIALHPDGSVFSDADGNFIKYMNYADAQVDKARGVILCTTADENRLAPGNAVFGRGVYHSFDYPFYYYNLRANAANRVAHFK